MLTLGNVSDVKVVPAMRYLLGDKGYDAGRQRHLARDAGAVPVNPGRRNRKRFIRASVSGQIAPLPLCGA